MTIREVLQTVDHTLLKPEATWNDVEKLCNEAIWGEVSSVCVAPCFVEKSVQFLEGKIPVCTVIGFPHGNMTTESKVFATKEAIKHGAKEIDMVINIGAVKEENWDAVFFDIQEVRKASVGTLLKVIIETCLLTEKEKIKLCELVSKAQADYIKTSTGFSSDGAKLEDILLFHEYLAQGVKVKASGGIRDFETAERFIKAGAHRIGSSALIALARHSI